MRYLKNLLSKKNTPQSEPIPGAGQVQNSAAGYTWKVDDWTRLNRFLILGCEGGSYYSSERKLAVENAQAVLRCLREDGDRTVRTIVEISEAGRAPKQDPALFALALATTEYADAATRRAALAALPRVCRIGTHLFQFAGHVDGMRGWGRGLRSAVAAWYGRPAEEVAFQAVKYQQREGWSHRDLLRLSHPKVDSESSLQAVYRWIVKGWDEVGAEPPGDPSLRLIWAWERARRATTQREIVGLIREHRLPREAVPSEWLQHRDVWDALLDDMPMTALIRNLATLTRLGVVAPGSDGTKRVVEQLQDETRLRRARVHPIAVLAALTTYRSGKGVRGSGEWKPVPKVVDALDSAFYAAFGNIPATGKRWLLALDVSGSMQCGSVSGIPGLTPHVASSAMAMLTARTESEHVIVGFTAASGGVGGRWGGGVSGITPIPISPRQRLDDVARAVGKLPMGGTDCALPMLWATQNKVAVDVFVVYTDNETWAGKIHPAQALQEYRQRLGIPAKLIVVAMLANPFTIADPND
ncbi:MAG: TROVE domain-containing protein, partial [Armatimonadetes bacterium]|nr:TROVE domain-containing protein [Armatimonadota bacterium]